jgi:hypothetical protein
VFSKRWFNMGKYYTFVMLWIIIYYIILFYCYRVYPERRWYSEAAASIVHEFNHLTVKNRQDKSGFV